MDIDGVDKSTARRIVRALRNGATPVQYAQDIFTGQVPWYTKALGMMSDTAEDKDFEVRFVRAMYGGGKTLFLRCLEATAKVDRWCTAFVIFRHDEVELDRFHTLVTEIGRKLVQPTGEIGLTGLLRSAFRTLSKRAGYSSEGGANSLATIERYRQTIVRFCEENAIDYEFGLAIRAAAGALIDHDQAYFDQIANWLGSGSSAIVIDPQRLGSSPSATRAAPTRLKPIGQGQAEQFLRLIALLARESGSKGLFLAFDELELVSKLAARRRDNAFQTLRALVEHHDPILQPPSTCLFFAATPIMFEDPQMFPAYKALQDRIESMSIVGSGEVNYMAPVIDLDRTELGKEDLLQLAKRILALYRKGIADPPSSAALKITKLVDAILAKRYVIARPRLLCRCLVDLLDGKLGDDISKDVSMVARELELQHERELQGAE
jgi:hypothetical protein